MPSRENRIGFVNSDLKWRDGNAPPPVVVLLVCATRNSIRAIAPKKSGPNSTKYQRTTLVVPIEAIYTEGL
jgi:hypothetical protein